MATRKEIAQNQKILYDDAVANNMFQAAVPTFKEFQKRLEGQGYQKMVFDNYKKHNVKGKGFNNLNEFRGAFGGSFYADENKIGVSGRAQAISASAQQTMNNVGRYNRLKQRKQKQQKDFGRVNLGTHQTPYVGDANNVVKDDFAYNPETGKAGAYVTSDNENVYSQNDAEQKQNLLDKYGEEWNNAVDMGVVPSELDMADPDLSDTDVAMRQMERRQEWLNENQDRRSKELNESMHLQGSPFVASGGAVAPSSFNTAISNEANRLSDVEYGAYNTAKAYNQMLRTTLLQELKEQKQRNENAGWLKDKWNDVSNYFGAMFNTMLDPKLYSQGVMDAAIANNLLQVKKGMEDGTIKKGSNAGNAAQAMLGAIQQQQGEAAKQQQYGTKAYLYGDMSGRSLKFMGDFALSGWRNVMTTGFTKAGEKVGEKMALGALGKWFTKNTGRVLGDIAGSAALAATNQLGSTYNNVIERYVGMNNENGGVTQDKNGDLKFNEGVSLGKAIKDGFGSATIENFSEMFGEYLPGAPKLLSKLGLSKVSSFFEKIGNNAYYKWLSNATNKSGIQGVMAEISEEEFGTALHAAWGDGDGSWSDFNVFTNPDAREKQIDTCLGMFYSVGFMQAPRTAVGAINAVQYFNIKHQVAKADKFGQMMFNDKWDEIKSKIDVTTNADLTKTVLDATRSDSMTAKQKGAVINYAMFLSKLRGFNQAADAKTKDKVEEGDTAPTLSNDLDDAYTEGHNADDADKHNIQLEQNDKANELAAMLHITPEQLHNMADEDLEAMTGQGDKLDQAIYDYQVSTAKYQGVMDGAQDEVDMAAHQAAMETDNMTDLSRGTVRKATIKATGGLEDYEVYIISGNIATHDDGSIDVGNSDDMIIYYDPTTGRKEHADAMMFADLIEELPAADVKAQAVADAKEKAIKEVAGIVDGTIDVGSQFKVTGADGLEHTYEILADYGDGTAAISIDGNVVENPYSLEDLQQLKDLEDQKRLEAAKAEREQMEKERAEQTQETELPEETQPSLDFNQILNDNGNVVLVDVLDKDGNTKYPESKLFLIRDTGAKAKVVEMKSDGTFVPHAVSKKNVATISSMSLDEYKQAMAETSMIEENSGAIEGDRGGIEVNDELPPVPDNVTINGDGTYSVDGAVQGGENTTAPAEQTEQTPAMTLEDGTIVPMLEDGNPDFSKLTADQTAELYDSQFGDDADSVISGWVSDAKKALDKANNMTVKGKNFVEQKAAKEAKEKAIADAQVAYDSAIAIRDAYNSRQLAKVEDDADGRKNLIEKARRKFARMKSAVKDDAEAVSQLYKDVVGSLLHRLYDGTGIDVTDTIPLTAEEYVASNLGAHSLNYEGTETSKGVKQETGLSREDFAKTQLLAADGKGTTIDDLVHSLWENRPSNLESLDTQDIRNALIGVLTSGFKASEARNYIENLRIAQAENILEEQKKAADNAAFAEENKAESEQQTETAPESEEKAGEDNSDEMNDEENEKINEQTNENINAPEVPEDATEENPLGAQRDQTDLPFSARDNGTQQTTSERAADVEKNKVDDMKVVDNIVGEKTRKAFERLAKMMGASIQWQYSDKLGNGWIQETTDADGNVHRTIFITLDSSITEGAQFIFGHEMTHQIKNLNPAAYNELTQLVLDTYGSDAFDKAVDETMQRYSDAGFSGRARDYYAEEVVADAVGEMIRDLNLAHTLAMKMSHPLLAAIHEILQKIKLVFFGTEYSDVTKNIIRSIEQAYVKTANGEVTNSETGEDVSFSLRQKPEPKKKGIGYKVFVLKDGKLYPPMVANPDGAATPVGVWLDADAAPIAGESKTGRPQVKQGGKGTQGGSGKLAYRPGWHLGVVPYAIQFNRKDAEGNKTLFPKNFVFAEVEYAADVDYQEEARQEGINPSGKYQHSLAGLKHLPTDGYYMYRTNPNPETDPWVITGAMKVNRILTRAEQAELVKNAGREPQQIQEGDIVTDDVVNSINQEIADAPKFSIKTYHGSQASFDKFSIRLKSAIEDTETNPSDAQKESGNYKKGHIKFGGYDYTIENPKGSTRSGKDANGKEWKVTMHDTYGYIRGKFGKDGDHLDMFINDKADLDNWNGDVFVVDQVNPDGSFDEHKVMYGYDSMDDAKKAYLANYNKGWKGLGNISGASKDEFDKWLGTSNRKLKPFADYAKVKFPLKDIKPVGIGAFGNIYNQFRGNAKAAIEFLKKVRGGEAVGALHHKDIGDIDLVWGKEGTGHSDGYGLSKLVKYHPEVLDNLQEILNDMRVVSSSKNRVNLESETHKAGVRLTWDGERKSWLLTAFKKETSASDKRTDTAATSLEGDTALSQTEGSAAKIDNSSETAKENGEKFSLKDEKTLAGVHNITEEKLRKALKLGGFANPSLAVIDTNKTGHDNFGEISFIAPSALLDKRTGNTGGTWITDAYTQRYPSVEREMSEKGYRKFEDWVDSLDYPSGAKAEIKRQTKDVLEDNGVPAWELMYLKEKGIDIKAYDSNVDYRWKEIISDHPTAEDILNSMKTDPELNEKVTSLAKHAIIHPTWEKVSLEVRRKMYKETGVKASPINPKVRKQTKEIFERDYAPTLLNKDGSPRKKDVKKVVEDIVKEHNDTKKYDFYLSKVKASNYVNKNGLYDDYIRWQENKLDEFGTKNRIFRGYTKDGSRKYVPETLENVSKVMREEADGQTNGSEYTSFGSFIAKLASRVDSTDEMRANKDKLSSNKDKEEFYEKWSEVYYDLAKFLYNDVFYGEQRLHDIVLQSDPKKYAKKEYGITLTPTFMKKLDALKNAVQTELKSAYFETKYNRPLYLNEFAAAVVPDNLGEDVRKGIENAGLPMYDYDPNKEGDRSRAFNEAINSSDNIRFSLAGERGAAAADKAEERTFRMDNLSVARKMEEEKKDAKVIKMATGWERGADGKWRYEMPDAKIKDTMDVGGGHIVKRYEDDMLWNGGKLSKVIDAPELFKAYPQLKDVRIETDAIMNDMPSNGEYNAKTNTITIHADELKYMNSILNHEIQHAIQSIEGFDRGGSPRLVRGEIKKKLAEVTKQIRQLRAEGKEDEAKAIVEKNRGLYNAYQANDDYNSYKSLAGEVEARNVQERMNMTPEERRKTLAESTEDVARKDQIFLGVGDVSFSLRDMADGKESGAADMAEDLRSLNTPGEVDDAIKSAIDDMPSGWQMVNKKMIHIAQALGENRKAEIAGDEPKFSLKDGSLIKAGTYFSGGGLVEEGLKGIIDPVVAVEYDEKISGVYRNNFGQHIVTADVRDVDPKELVKQIDGEVEYFHASPVCKNYSQAKSNHAEVELDKETAASTAEFINSVKPKVVTIENVKGYKDSEAMKIITDALDANGYTWDADVYNAADYGGYTNRERLIVRAVRDGKLPEKPKKMAHKSGWYEAVEDIIPILTEKKNGVAPWMDIRLKADGIDWRNIDKPLYVMGSAYADGKIPHAFADELLPTLRTKSGDVIVMPDGKVYRAMGRVLARVSGVSDDYKMPFSENLSHTIIGNGIPTQLTEHVIAPLLQNTLRPTTTDDGNTKFSLRYDKFEHDLNQWKKDNNLPKDAQRPTIPQRNAGESAVDFLRRVDEYRKQMALWKTAPTYEQHLLSDDTALGEFNRELQKGSVLKRIAFQDSMLAIRKAQEAIMKEVGVDRLNMAEDAYTAENRSHGKGKNEFEEYNNEFLQPLRKAYHQMKKVLGDSYDNVRVYMMAKHGLERDAQMAFKKSLEADYEDVNQRSAAYKAYKNDLDRVSNDADLEFGRVDFTTWRQKDNALRGKYSPSYMDYRYDDNGIAYDYSGLSSLFDGSDFEEAAHRLVRDVETKHLAEVQALWNATNAATKKILRDGFKAEMMSKDAYEYVKGMYSHYIPLRGWDGTTADQVWDYIGGGKGAFNQTLKTAHGRTSIADDPIAYIENMAESGILLNNKNWVKQHLMLLAQNHPTSLLTLSKAWYVKSTDANGNEEWIPATPQITSQMNSNQVKAAIDAFEQKMEQLAQTGDATQQRDGLNIAYPQTHSEEREHEVRVMKDGEEYVIYVNGDPQLAQAMNNTRAHRVREIQSGKLDRAAAWLGRKMAAAYTSLSPLFIPSNYFRDLTMTLASTAIREDGRYNYLLRKNLATSWNLGFMLRDYQNGKLREKVNNGNATAKEQMFYDFMMNGGETGFVSSLDVEDLKKKFKNDLKDLDRWKANPVKVGHTIMDGIEFLNRAIEDSNRFAVYMTSIQYGRSIDEAVNDAKDVTLNFNRKGTGEYGWQMIRNLYLFINPAVQSLQTLGALTKHHPFKFTAVTAAWLASGVLVPIVNAAMMSLLGGDDDKDKYWQFSKWDRRNNAIMWIPFTNEYVKIPLAQEFRAFYGIGDMIASKMMGGELAEETWSQYAEDLLGQVVDMLPLDPTGYDGNIAVSLMPNPIRPVFELAFNVDFTGKPLFKETEYNKYDPNFTKAYVGTPDWLVRVSKMVNSIGNDYPDVQQNAIDAFGDPRYNLNNPAVVDHVLSSYLGGAYTMGSQVLGVLTKSLNDPKEIKMADIPLVSKFVSNPDDRPVTKKQGDEFWNMKENHDRAANTLSKLKKQAKVDGDYSMLERFYGSEEYKQYKQEDVKVKKYEEDKKKERAEESGEEYRPHKLNAEDIYKAHATPKDDFEDLKLKQLYTKLNGFKTSYDLLVDTAPSQSDGYYNTNKVAIDAIYEISLNKQEISELKKGFLEDGKDAYNAEDMKRIRELRKRILSVLEPANKVVVANLKAKAEKK